LQTVYIVNACTHDADGGNPAAVCVLEGTAFPDEAHMQQLAAEMNLSETAFVIPDTGELRWFTPTHEVDLCGHATLDTAHVLLSGAAAPLL